MRGWILLALLAAYGSATLGCAHRHPYCASVYRPASAPIDQALPEVMRGSQAEAIARLETHTALPTYVPAAPGTGYRYFALTAAQCQCIAVEASSQGNLLASERRAIVAQALRQRRTSAAAPVVRDVLLTAEREARNASALAALSMYYGLAEAEQRLDQVWLSEQALASAIDQLKQLRDRGLPLPLDESELVRQQLELQAQRIDLEAQIDKLNSQLRTQLDLADIDGRSRFWPNDPLQVDPVDRDPATEIAIGLAERPLLIGLRRLSRQLNKDTLQALRMLLIAENPLLGTDNSVLVPVLVGLMSKDAADEREAAVRRGQLLRLLASRETAISEEIRVEVMQLNAQARKTSVIREQLRQARAELQRVEDRVARGDANFGDQTKARIEVWKFEGELIASAAKWHTARARLSHQQGRLLAECCQYHTTAMTMPLDAYPLTEDGEMTDLPAEEPIPPGDQPAMELLPR